MANPNGAKGARWAAAIVDYLIAQGWPHAETRNNHGSKDRGDIAGVIGVVIEAKNERRIDLAGYIRETGTEQRNDNAAVGVAWVKRRGKTSAADGYVVMTGAQFTSLLREAGYHPDSP